ncbi:MAG: hypothetical protein FJ128_05610 [Deltaproteobacteria bacterium]|nr:hypothetical protein [Deltaproteobacteria bacterium]
MARRSSCCWLPSPLWGAGLALFGLIAWSSFFNLANYPTIWWDEAIFSETAANLAQQGRYALTVQSPDQLRDFDYRISAGPSVILPVALAYRLLGVSLVSGRLVAGFYLLFAFFALFLAARRLWGAGTALGAVALAFLGTDVLYWGRSVLGDIPALGLFLCAIWLILRGLDRNSDLSLFGGGVFLGLAFAAKEFYGLAFLPPLAAIFFHSRQQGRGPLLRLGVYSAGLALPLLAYLTLKAVILGGYVIAVTHFLEQKALLCHEFFTPLTIGRVYPESFAYLLGHPLFWLGNLGILWHWRREPLSLGGRLWVANFWLWCLVYLTAVYWERFALPALFLASPLAAHFLGRALARLTAGLAGAARRWAVGGMTLVFLALFYPATGLDLMALVATESKNPPARMVQYLSQRVPAQCLIETPEYELVFLSDRHRFHLMPAFFFVESTPDRVVLLNPRGQPYDFNAVQADLLILGSFGKSVFRQVYCPVQLTRHWRKVGQVDYYDIYAPRNRGLKWWKKKPAAGDRTGFNSVSTRQAPSPGGMSAHADPAAIP